MLRSFGRKKRAQLWQFKSGGKPPHSKLYRR
jgi:hypothetical protein